MDIFLSYRRGEVDTLFAGWAFEHLSGLGYRVFFDNDEHSNRVGEAFPDTLRGALSKARVVLAVIGPSWLAQASRLQDPQDWVRNELLQAAPEQDCTLIPVYHHTTPASLHGLLPAELQFVTDIQTTAVWTGFGPAERAELRRVLAPWLPPAARSSANGDVPRLELLCDRSREESGFHRALRRATEPGGVGWLLFGEDGQGHYALFDRVEAFTLADPAVQERYQSAVTIKLELGEFHGSTLEDMTLHVLESAHKRLTIDIPESLAALSAHLARRRKLALFYTVVVAQGRAQARWWHERFAELVKLPPAADSDKRPHMLFALAVSYAPPVGRWRALFQRGEPAEAHFADAFPQLFREGEAAAQSTEAPGVLVTGRLRSATRAHVESWCEHVQVKALIEGRRVRALQPFETAPQLPMAQVLQHLGDVLRTPASESKP
ncbi:MAG TPA: toll/interleukin-1 receptor domain-containing protein [Aquabacterium sp.]|nr:toll/interleukin-1 receptor domain-containing protein [Aquabacterium sp.]HQC96094.1 toll/interleukin-1 receptor domain-containing protein [Aquabacterium sp.]